MFNVKYIQLDDASIRSSNNLHFTDHVVQISRGTQIIEAYRKLTNICLDFCARMPVSFFFVKRFTIILMNMRRLELKPNETSDFLLSKFGSKHAVYEVKWLFVRLLLSTSAIALNVIWKQLIIYEEAPKPFMNNIFWEILLYYLNSILKPTPRRIR